MMKVRDFISRLLQVGCDTTLYVMGGWGQALTPANKNLLIKGQKYNQSSTRKKMIEDASEDTRAFDCSGLIKSVLWGYGEEYAHPTCGAKYASNNVPDHSAAQLIGDCYGVSSDMTNITPGELLYMKGHVGIYIGDGEVIECTPKWKNGVQITKLSDRKWEKHGFLPYVEYDTPAVVHIVPAPTLRRGCKNMRVSQLQDCLVSLGYDMPIDGSYGPKTQGNVRNFQGDNDLVPDGVYGPKTRNKLLEVMK